MKTYIQPPNTSKTQKNTKNTQKIQKQKHKKHISLSPFYFNSHFLYFFCIFMIMFIPKKLKFFTSTNIIQLSIPTATIQTTSMSIVSMSTTSSPLPDNYDMSPIDEYESIYGPIGHHKLSYIYSQVKTVQRWSIDEIRDLFEQMREQCVNEMREYDNYHDIHNAEIYITSLDEFLEMIDIEEHTEFLKRERNIQ